MHHLSRGLSITKATGLFVWCDSSSPFFYCWLKCLIVRLHRFILLSERCSNKMLKKKKKKKKEFKKGYIENTEVGQLGSFCKR